MGTDVCLEVGETDEGGQHMIKCKCKQNFTFYPPQVLNNVNVTKKYKTHCHPDDGKSALRAEI